MSTYVSRFAVEDVSTATSRAAKELGCRQLKDKQYQAVSEFICGKDIFISLSTGSRNRSAMLCCPPFMIFYASTPALPRL